MLVQCYFLPQHNKRVIHFFIFPFSYIRCDSSGRDCCSGFFSIRSYFLSFSLLIPHSYGWCQFYEVCACARNTLCIHSISSPRPSISSPRSSRALSASHCHHVHILSAIFLFIFIYLFFFLCKSFIIGECMMK